MTPPDQSDATWQRFEAARARAMGRKRFRGGAVDNQKDAPMGKGHGNNGRPFDIETACYLKPLFAEYDKAVQTGNRLKLVVKAGVKTMKSFALEICAAEHVSNRSGDAAIFFGSEQAADTTSTTRILEFFNGITAFKEKLATITGQWDYTMGAVKFPDKTLFILSANLGNTQQKNLAFCSLQDAFVTAKTGMIDEMIARTTQYQKEAIIFLESQGGEEGFDFERHYEDTDQGELHVTCQHCGKPHIFNWKAFDEDSMQRPESFVPTPPLIIPSLDHQAWIDHHRPILISKERRIAGFQRGDEKLVKLPNGDYDEAAILRETCFECYFCGCIWRDDGEYGKTRIHLDQSSHYVAARTDALPYNKGFNFPQWINRRLPWGPMMMEKLKVNRTAKETGNWEPVKIWWQKVAARTWLPKEMMLNRVATVSPGSYDPTLLADLIANAHSVDMAIDCQEDSDHKEKTGASITGWFWFIIRVFAKNGDSKQLARGFVKGWENLIAIQRHWKIPNDRVMIDCLFDPVGVRNKAIEYRETVQRTKRHPIFGMAPDVVTWKLLQAMTRQTNFKHKDKKERPWSEELRDGGYVIDEKSGKPKWITVPKILFNKNPVRLQVDALYTSAPGMAKFEVLSREHLKLPDGKPDKLTLDAETGKRTYENQMQSQAFNIDKNKYDELHKDDHFYWCEQGLIVRAGMDGLLGNQAVYHAEE